MNKVPGFDKLLEVMASGIGAVAGPMLAPWRARREGQARIIAAEADARVLEWIRRPCRIRNGEGIVGRRVPGAAPPLFPGIVLPWEPRPGSPGRG